jgi:hypothetical protein
MTTGTPAGQQLVSARAEERKAKRQAAKEQIKQLRREGAALLKMFRPMVPKIRAAEQERLKLNGLLSQAKNRIEFYSAPLDPAQLPTNEKLAAHAAQLTAWKAKQQKLLAQYADAVKRESIRAEAVAIQNRLQYLWYSLQNLGATAEGRRPGELSEGGAFKGMEDFLGHPDRRFS